MKHGKSMRGGRDYVSNLGHFSDRELTLGFTMELRLTGNHGNLPEMSELRESTHSCQSVPPNLCIVSIFKDRDFIRI